LEERFLAALRIQNPNPVDLAIEGIAYDLEENGQPFAKGVGKCPVVIPAFGQGLVETEAITTFMGHWRWSALGGPSEAPIATRTA
jgi:LEA14-like dessication related protein